MPKTAFDGVIHYLRTVFPDPAAKQRRAEFLQTRSESRPPSRLAALAKERPLKAVLRTFSRYKNPE